MNDCELNSCGNLMVDEVGFTGIDHTQIVQRRDWGHDMNQFVAKNDVAGFDLEDCWDDSRHTTHS